MLRALSFVGSITFFTFALTACPTGAGKDPEPDAPMLPDPNGGRGPIAPAEKTITVEGTALLHSVTLGGDLSEPLFYGRGSTLAAYLAPEKDVRSTWSPVELAIVEDGAFKLKSVPKDGAYYLRHENQWVVSTRASIDLSRYRIGRPDAEPCSYAGTKLVLEADGLDAWKDGDELQLVAANTGAMVFGLEQYAVENRMTGGSTTIDQMTIRWFGTGESLIDGSNGDQAIFTQLSTKTSRGKSYRAVTGAMIPSAFRMLDGEVTTVRGSFNDAGENKTLGLRIDPSAVRAMAQELNPTAVHSGSMFFVDAEPFGGEHGHVSATPDLLVLDLGTGSSMFDVELEFLNPFPASWTLFYQLRDDFRVSVLAEGATEPADVLISLLVNDTYEALAAGSEPARVGPASSIAIEGKSAFLRHRLSTATPSLRWEAPALGTADAYALSVYRVSAKEGRTETEYVSTLAIDGALREVRVPPGVLRAGETYVFIFSAHQGGGSDAILRPYEGHFPEAYAESISGLVTILEE